MSTESFDTFGRFSTPSMLRLPSVPESVSAAVDAAEAAVRELGLSSEVLGRVSLAVAEAVANAIEHGNGGEAHREVEVELQPGVGSLSVRVCDGGAGIETSDLETAQLPDDPLQTHGRGLFLIRVLTDGCEIEDGCVRLRFEERAA